MSVQFRRVVFEYVMGLTAALALVLGLNVIATDPAAAQVPPPDPCSGTSCPLRTCASGFVSSGTTNVDFTTNTAPEYITITTRGIFGLAVTVTKWARDAKGHWTGQLSRQSYVLGASSSHRFMFYNMDNWNHQDHFTITTPSNQMVTASFAAQSYC